LPLHSFNLGEGETTIPPRYTDETLIMAMANIYKHVVNPEYRARLKAKEGGGIGTPATRATMLEELVANGYLSREGKAREFVPSAKSMELMQLVPEQLRLPDMTAMWQLLTDEVKAGRSSHQAFMEKINGWVARVVQAAPQAFKPGQFGAAPGAPAPNQVCFGSLGKPGCGAPLRVVRGVKGKYDPFMACTSESCGKAFSLRDGKAVERAPRVEQPPEGERLTCPVCGKGQILRRQRGDGAVFWSCSGYREGCKAAYNDLDGKPDIEGTTKRQFEVDKTHSCPKCSGGFLQRRARKAEKGGGYFWGCSAWKEGCDGIFSDRADGTPDLHAGRYTRGGAPRMNARTGRVR
jgi:DNA topoisomerase III